MIVEAFLRWADTARASDRAKAANALGRAYLRSSMAEGERRAAVVAMTYLLDDPAPQVRQALADALCASSDAPRSVVAGLAEDQLEIACAVILRSPVLTDADLVDLVGRGADHTRALIAARRPLGIGVVAALAEIADLDEILILLENDDARFARSSLDRIAERHGDDAAVRSLLLDRADLPAEARHRLLQHVTTALSGHGLVQAAMGARRVERVAGEAQLSAAITLAGSVEAEECASLVEHLRAGGRLTPAFLMQVLCLGRTEFFTRAITRLTGLEDRRVRSILATGRFHAVRALIESAGLGRSVSPIFVEAVMLWREAQQSAPYVAVADLLHSLLRRIGGLEMLDEQGLEMMELVGKLHRAEERRQARDYASSLALAAA